MAQNTKQQKNTAPNIKNKNRTRRVRHQTYKSFKLTKRIKPGHKSIDVPIKLFIKSLKLIRRNLRLFLIITLIYGLLSIVLVRGVGGGLDLTALKDSLKNGIGGSFSQLVTGTVLFGYLIGSSGSSANANASAGTYQTILIVVMSLVVIWALRQVIADKKIKVRDAFYNGTYPLIQFVLVLIVVTFQLLPMTFGTWIYSTAIGGGIAVTPLEKFIWLILSALLILLSLYMVTSSVFALYIVTLPKMTPLKALRSARGLVRYRRWTVLSRIIFLPIAIIVLGAVIMIPLILILTAVAQWVFFALSMFVLVVVHSYMYSLYRELL